MTGAEDVEDVLALEGVEAEFATRCPKLSYCFAGLTAAAAVELSLPTDRADDDEDVLVLLTLPSEEDEVGSRWPDGVVIEEELDFEGVRLESARCGAASAVVADILGLTGRGIEEGDSTLLRLDPL